MAGLAEGAVAGSEDVPGLPPSSTYYCVSVLHERSMIRRRISSSAQPRARAKRKGSKSGNSEHSANAYGSKRNIILLRLW